ncbi:MAG: FkbM family methyltransferase [Candidatus Dormibacteraeota bacterium]|nr:FkbM family methyltransferase [Candidatus Dormibacteraeota bacterium]
MSEWRIDLKRRVRRLLPRGVRAHRIHAGPLKGRRLVTSWHDYPAALLGYTEKPLIEWFRRNVQGGETWIDVGAHYGYTALALSHLVGPQGRVFAFEPVVSTAGHLQATRALNQVEQLHVIPLALGPRPYIEFVRATLLRGMADHGPNASAAIRTEILAIAFDELWPCIAGGTLSIHGVKIDVQGMEIEVLSGMARTLQTFRPLLVVEIHRGVDRRALLELLASIGYPGTGEPIGGGRDLADDCSYCFRAGPQGRGLAPMAEARRGMS